MSEHPTEELLTCCGTVETIDVEMVPLMRALWLRGVHTCNGCCQGDPGGRAWIAFPDLEEADKFYEAITAGGAPPNQVVGTAIRDGTTDPNGLIIGGWRWELRSHMPPSKAQVHLTFPNDQIPQVVHWLSDQARADHTAWLADLDPCCLVCLLPFRMGGCTAPEALDLAHPHDGANPCRDCAAHTGELHHPGCCVARCKRTGHQTLTCDCDVCDRAVEAVYQRQLRARS